ncbi:hypothetical protein HDU98_008442 [Podochytrium sp. JEL0797]|nr:hypothetical protein HDU98_008442 [Podochytrium sp. JEL0797]
MPSPCIARSRSCPALPGTHEIELDGSLARIRLIPPPVTNHKKQCIRFNENVTCFETFGRHEYNRSSHPKAELTFRDVAELVCIKMQLEKAAKCFIR